MVIDYLNSRLLDGEGEGESIDAAMSPSEGSPRYAAASWLLSSERLPERTLVSASSAAPVDPLSSRQRIVQSDLSAGEGCHVVLPAIAAEPLIADRAESPGPEIDDDGELWQLLAEDRERT